MDADTPLLLLHTPLAGIDTPGAMRVLSRRYDAEIRHTPYADGHFLDTHRYAIESHVIPRLQ